MSQATIYIQAGRSYNNLLHINFTCESLQNIISICNLWYCVYMFTALKVFLSYVVNHALLSYHSLVYFIAVSVCSIVDLFHTNTPYLHQLNLKLSVVCLF